MGFILRPKAPVHDQEPAGETTTGAIHNTKQLLKKNPKISIIVPSLNQGKFIGQTLNSVLSQSYREAELIVIDGGSTDNTLEVVSRYRDQLSYFVSEKDSGQSQAINKGLAKASGDIVTWLNSDDYYEPGALEKIVRLFESHPDAGIVHGKAILFGEGKRSRLIGSDTDLKKPEYLAYMRFPQPASFFSKAALLAAGPADETLHYAMDFELAAKIILAGFGVVRTSELLAHYRLHPDSKTNHDLRFLTEWTQVLLRILGSLPHGERHAQALSELTGIKRDAVTYRPLHAELSPEETEQIFLKHLNIRFHYLYRATERSALKHLGSYLSKNHPQEYRLRGYGKYLTRLKILPTFALAFLRRFTR